MAPIITNPGVGQPSLLVPFHSGYTLMNSPLIFSPIISLKHLSFPCQAIQNSNQ